MAEKFNIKKLTGKNVDPDLAAEKMRMCAKYSRKEFKLHFFSRLFQQDKKSCSADYESAVYEKSKNNLKSAIQDIFPNCILTSNISVVDYSFFPQSDIYFRPSAFR